MKKRLLFLFVFVVLCVTVFSVSAYAVNAPFRLELTTENGSTLNKPHETWYFWDATHVYATTGEQYTYTKTVKTNGTEEITLSGGSFTSRKITIEADGKTATAIRSGKTCGFAVHTGTESFKPTLTLSQGGNQLTLSFGSSGGTGSVTYHYHVYDGGDELFASGTTTDKSVKIEAYEGGKYTAFVTASDANFKVSDYARATVTFTPDPNFVVIDGALVSYLGTDTDITVPSTVNGSAVTAIGANAFSDCTTLERITLPDNISSVGANAFANCPAKLLCNLTSNTAKTLAANDIPFYDKADANADFELIYVKEGSKDVLVLKAYRGTAAEIVTPAVGRIGGSAFSGNGTVKKITVNDSVTEIDANAFSGCTSLEKVLLPDNVNSINSKAFYNCQAKIFCNREACYPDLPNKGTAYALSMIRCQFYDLSEQNADSPAFALLYITTSETSDPMLALYRYTGAAKKIIVDPGSSPLPADSIFIPDYILFIYDNAFAGNSQITEVYIPNTVTGIGASAFSNCTRLAKVTAGTGVKSIGADAFSGCNALKEINLGPNVGVIGDNAFYNCPAKIFCDPIDSVTAKAISRVPHDFYHTYLSTEYAMRWIGKELSLRTVSRSLLPAMIVPTGVNVIEEGAFDSLKATITYALIPGTVSVIPTDLFNGFEKLDWIYLGDGVTELADRAITNCPELTTVTLPDSLKKIGAWQFSECPKLEKLELPDNLETISTNAFTGCIAKLHCTVGSDTAKKLSAINHIFYSKDDTDGKYGLQYITVDGVETLALRRYSGIGAVVNDIPAGVTYIDSGAFRDIKTITEIQVPATVTGIGTNAFYGCSKLTKILLLNKNLQAIDEDTFNGCTAGIFCYPTNDDETATGTAKRLSAIGHPFYHISEYGKEVPPAFALLYADDDETLTLHAYTGNSTKVTVPGYVEAIDSAAFDSVKATMTQVTIGPCGVKTIPSGLFDGFEKLDTIALGSGNVETVEPGAIRNCPNLEHVTGLTRVNAIPTMRTNFDNCPKLALKLTCGSVRLAIGVPFAERAKIEGLPIGESNDPNIATYTYGTYPNGAVTAVKAGNTSILVYSESKGQFATIPVEVRSGLKGLTLPSILDEIFEEAFAGNNAAQYVTLPGSLTKIGKRAFADDKNLLLINLPDLASAAKYGELTFSGCDSLVAVVSEGGTAEAYCKANGIPFQYAY